MAHLSLKQLSDLVEDGELDLCAMQLTEVPPALPMVSKVSVVDMSSNKIPVLPDEVCKMNRLVRLDLGKNRLHHLPNDIGNLANLQHLNLQGNNIEELPLSFANLKSLKWLDLRNNPLEVKLAKAAGNCGNDKECRTAAQNVLNFMSEKKKFVEYQKEKEKKVNEKIKLKNNEEKKKKANADGNAKSNGQKEASSSKPATAAKTAPVNPPTTAKKAPAPARKQTASQTDGPKPKDKGPFLFRVFRFFLYLAFYGFFAVFGAATVVILMDCNNGGKDIAGVVPLCHDFTRMANFEAPLPHFKIKASNAYYYVIMSNYRKFRASYFNPYRNKVYKAWDNFKRTQYGGPIAYGLHKIHSFVVKTIMIAFNFYDAMLDDLIAWYDNGGYKTVDAILEPIQVATLMVLEVLRDVAIHVIEALVYIWRRVHTFADTWMEQGYDAAMKTFN